MFSHDQFYNVLGHVGRRAYGTAHVRHAMANVQAYMAPMSRPLRVTEASFKAVSPAPDLWDDLVAVRQTIEAVNANDRHYLATFGYLENPPFTDEQVAEAQALGLSLIHI